jgi:hypothetical protein
MAQTSPNPTPEQLARDAAMIDALERRRDGGAAADVPAEWQPEVEAWLRLQRRVRSEPLPEVAPSVRSVVLGAAAELAPTYAAVSPSWWSRWLQPVPLMAGLTAAALAVAVAVRWAPGHGRMAGEVATEGAMVAEAVEAAAEPGPGAARAAAAEPGVANAGAVEAHGEPAAAEARRRAVAPDQETAVAESPVAGAAAAPSPEAGVAPKKHVRKLAAGAPDTSGQAPPAAPALVARGTLPRTIEAVPASLGPAEADAATAKPGVDAVAQLRHLVDQAPSPADRLTLLRKLMAAARAAGDEVTLKWAESEQAKLNPPKQSTH